MFAGSLACLPAALWATRITADSANRRVFFALLSYVALGAGARALIPTYGQPLAVAYWGVAILALVYVCAWSRDLHPA